MKLTPLDIHHKEFRRAVRGYSEAEVDAFLDEVADEFERLFKENIDLSERLEAADEQVRGYKDMEKTLHNTMVAAQRSADDIVEKAKADAADIMRDAELKAKEIIHNALTEKQRVQAELLRIKQAEEEFRAQFGGLLDSYGQQLAEVRLPDDVQVMVGETAEGVVADVRVTQGAPEPVEIVEAGSVEAPEEPQAVEPPAGPEVAPIPDAEPPAPGFVTSVHLGEVEDTDLAAETPTFAEPLEFEVPAAGTLGERDEDVDIEEID